jgi:predicted GNAT superfamily acetyltransferase
MTGPVTGIEIRDLATREEFLACVRLQEATWGKGFSERVPTAILGIAARMGGVVAGAVLPDGEMVGFVFGLTGLDQDGPAHWSDMLAVRDASRGRGLGRALKLHQRDRLLALGIRRMYWSFDPLETRNAHLNFARLGVTSSEYVEDMYGISDSPLHAGIGTDRLVVRWEMDSPRVVGRLAGQGGPTTIAAGSPAVLEAAGSEQEGPGLPGTPVLGLEAARLTIEAPPDVQALKHLAPQVAAAWRSAMRAAFTHYLSRGWEVREFARDPERPRYLLDRPAPELGVGQSHASPHGVRP